MKGLLSALARKLFSILLCNHPPMDKVHTPSKYSHPILGNATSRVYYAQSSLSMGISTSRVCYAHSSLSMGISKAKGWFYLIYKPLLGNHSNITSFARARHNSNCSLTSAQPWSLKCYRSTLGPPSNFWSLRLLFFMPVPLNILGIFSLCDHSGHTLS